MGRAPSIRPRKKVLDFNHVNKYLIVNDRIYLEDIYKTAFYISYVTSMSVKYYKRLLFILESMVVVVSMSSSAAFTIPFLAFLSTVVLPLKTVIKKLNLNSRISILMVIAQNSSKLLSEIKDSMRSNKLEKSVIDNIVSRT